MALAAILGLAGAACGSATAPSGPSSSPTASGTPSATASPEPTTAPIPTIHAEVIATVDQPLGLVGRFGDDALYIVSKLGAVWALRNGRVDPAPALDLMGRVALGDEQGLLGLVFSPDGRFAYVDYTDRRGDTHVVEYAWTAEGADPASRREILFVDQPFPNHNGGNLVFGPDGYLYVGMGDGGSDYTRGDPQGDPDRNGQNLGVLLGKILRIQPRLADGSLPPGGARYAIPPDNPFVAEPGARPEIWAYGLRNPWRFSFDRTTADLWIGDVGAGAREEVDLEPAGSAGGNNYGWNAMEGTVAWRAAPPDAVPPLYEYDHRGGACAVTGGYVYRGAAIPDLVGWYVFGDYCTGVLHVLQVVPAGRRVYVAAGAVIQQLTSFGQDQQGELYATSLQGDVYRLIP